MSWRIRCRRRASATRILAVFGALALALAAVGLYGVVAFSVSQRSAELGLRMALGAPRHDVLRLVLRQGLLPVILGIVGGLIGAAMLTNVMRTLLYNVQLARSDDLRVGVSRFC